MPIAVLLSGYDDISITLIDEDNIVVLISCYTTLGGACKIQRVNLLTGKNILVYSGPANISYYDIGCPANANYVISIYDSGGTLVDSFMESITSI